MRYYSSTATPTTIVGDITSTQTSWTVAGLSGYPDETPFTVALDADTDNEELVDITDVSGNVVTATRGVAGTTAIGHSDGAAFEHRTSHRDYQEPQDHINASEEVHGLGASSSVVGTTDTQTLTNKSLDGDDNTFTNIPNSALKALAISKVTDLQDDLDAKMDSPDTAWSIGAVLVGTGSGTYDTTSSTTEGEVLTIQSNGSAAYSPLPGGLLAVTDYSSTTVTQVPHEATGTLVALDSTNLQITFTAPSSGKVLLRLTAKIHAGNSGGYSLQLGFQNASNNSQVGRYSTSIIYDELYYNGSGNGSEAMDYLSTLAQVVTGLSSGTSYTLNLVGGQGNTLGTFAISDVTIEAWAVPS